jgi:hypothetical protein
VDDRVAVCDRCFSVQHEHCWDRNSRCSTFRCPGLPRTMQGADLGAVLRSALEKANAEPTICPFCTNTVFAGCLQGKWTRETKDHAAGPGLLFVSEKRDEKGLLKRLKSPRTWFLPGAVIKGRSCGKCRRLFLWGVPVDEAFIKHSREEEAERFCPHCTESLWSGSICLDPKAPGGAPFACDDAPDFHKDWFGHNVLDRYVYNKWAPPIKALPAHSCPDCQYTEAAGHPIYRFL